VCPFEDAPRMKAVEITDAVIKAIESGKYEFIRLNYPNGDMVGHTGVFSAVTIAVEAVDECLGRLKAAVEKANGIMVVSADHGNADDMYEHLVYDGVKFTTIAQVEPKLYDRTLTVNGVSKAFSMTGWRIGYGAGSKELIAAITDIQSHSTSNPCSISQAASVAALNGSLDFMIEWVKKFAERRNNVVAGLNAINGINCSTPKGAFYVFPDCSALFGKKTPQGKVISDSTSFCEYLLEEALVAVVAGSAFGLDGHFRISYATSDAALAKACERIKIACDNLV
ncbi:MAG: aminotransferase class I/II-fold pyridoxal phosphate-dependent enzyme, partial [Pseudomonadota bacterium]